MINYKRIMTSVRLRAEAHPQKKESEMEFKFSCELFTVEFSGDPGFVESQMHQYEPFIMRVLARLDKEAGPAEKAPAPPPRPPSAPPPREQKNGSFQGKPASAPSQPGRMDRPFAPSRVFSEPKRPSLSSTEVHEEYTRHSIGQMSPDDITEAICDEKETPREPRREAAEKAPPPPEFIARRRAPRVRSEELGKVNEDLKPRTHHDRVMVYGHYMETQGKGSDFTVAEIKRCYRAVSQDPGDNIDRVINHATRSGFIAKHDQGKTVRFKLSSKGRKYVEDGLKLS